MGDISQSVGAWERGAKNLKNDVIIVQQLLKTISKGAKQPELDPGKVDGKIARPSQKSRTFAAINAFEGSYLSICGGLIEPRGETFKLLNAMAAIMQPFLPDAAFPPRPSFGSPGTEKVKGMFGDFEYEDARTADNPRGIRILGDWQRKNIVKVELPQLAKVTGGKRKHMWFHRLARQQLTELWTDWEKAGFLDRIITYDGSFNPRYISPSGGKLSLHSWGSAFDINAHWNQRKKIPAQLGEKGCVRELVPLANQHGFFWGGHYSERIADGMHFEVAVLAPKAET